MDYINSFNLSFFESFLFFFLIFFVGSILILKNKLYVLNVLGKQIEKLGGLNKKLHSKTDKQETITKFIESLSDKFVIKKIINEWLSLQRSLSNFQKYDFDIHINTFLERYRFNSSTFARNLLLLGLLFTFVYLSDSFIELKNSLTSGGEANTFINETLIPSVGMALTSTIAAIVVSFFVNIFGSYLDKKINNLHKELSDFLIIHVHPTFETAAEDTYIHKIKSVLDSLTQNIRESNQNLDAISRQSISTLNQLGEGISKFTTSTEEFKSLLSEFSHVQDQINDQNKEIRLAVSGLKDSVLAINTIFESESNIIEDTSKLTRQHSESIDKLIEATNELRQQQSSKMDSLSSKISSEVFQLNSDVSRKITGLTEEVSGALTNLKDEFNHEIIETLEANSKRLNSTLESSVESIEHISNKLGKEFSSNQNYRQSQIEELGESLTSITREFSENLKNEFTDSIKFRNDEIEKLNNALSSITEEYSTNIAELNRKTLSREKEFEKQTEEILNRQKKLLELTSKYLKSVEKHVGLFNSIKKIFN